MTASYITRTYSHEQRCSSLGLFSVGVLRKVVLGEEQDALSSVESVFASLALWRLAVPAGCPSLTLLPRGQHKEHHLSMSAQAQA